MSTFSHTVNTIYNSPGGPITNTQSLTGQASLDVTEAQAGSTTNTQYAVAFTVASLVGYILLSDQTVTIKTNSTSAPGNTITLTAGIPLIWYTGCPYTNKITVDVTTIYVTVGGSATANLRFSFLLNP